MTQALLDSILEGVGHAPADPGEVDLRGSDPILDTAYPIGEAAAAVLAACGVAVSDLWELRTGRRQRVGIDVFGAAAALLSFAHLRGAGDSGEALRRLPNPTTALYEARHGQWIHLHGGFPHLHEGTLRVLGCGDGAGPVTAAVAGWDAQALEDALAEQRLCGARVRTAKEWADHPQGLALASQPLVEVRQIGDSEPEPLPVRAAPRPLAGVRVLDLTRVLAGPTCGRTLAEHGADVMRIHAPHLPSIPPFVVDTGHGKLSTELDLRAPDQAQTLRDLVRDADVLSRGYRQGALEKHGLGIEALAALRPGIVVVSINCYGHEGPWSGRGGWEQLAQSVTGVAAEHGSPGAPRLLPAAATDYTTGYLAALGALVALARRWREGGSYEVRVSLARSGMWLQEGGRVSGAAAGLAPDRLETYLTTTQTPTGAITHLGPVLEMSETPPRWARPSVPLGTHAPVWPARSAA